MLELMIATLIFTIAAAGLISSVSAIITLTELSRENTIASSDLRTLLERVKATPFSDLLTDFPNGTIDGPSTNRYVNIVGNYTLRNEHITVTYANITTDPLEIRANLTWQDKKGRNYTAIMSTVATR